MRFGMQRKKPKINLTLASQNTNTNYTATRPGTNQNRASSRIKNGIDSQLKGSHPQMRVVKIPTMRPEVVFSTTRKPPMSPKSKIQLTN